MAVQWLYSLVKPLLIGTLLAMILSIPLDFIEKWLFRKKSTPGKEKARRPVAILRIPYAPRVDALVGVTALIPYVGAFIATIVGACMILTVNPFKAFVFCIYLLALQQVERDLVYHRVIGAKIDLLAMWVLAAITVGGNLAGPGMLLGVPAASAVSNRKAGAAIGA